MNLLYNVFFFVVFDSIHFFVICQNIPNPRCQQTSALVGTKLYFFGGLISRNSISNEVWYLDLSNSFNVTTPQWHQDSEMILGYNLGSSCISPIDNSTVFLIGGRTWFPNTLNYKYNSSVYIFNSNTSLWTTPNINNFNSSFTGRNEMQAVIDSKGKIFIFGGTDYYDHKPIYTMYTDMNIFDITTMTWSTQIQPQSLVYVGYTATLLSNGLIIYIGGLEDSGTSINYNYVNMNQVWFG
ncbi:hypothetical protein C2G38_2147477 [Gigaspora rosea]|uniref:Attractin/MKLN-like beta-propeller domain-containing protein n=1 Tax=Gigaspora rosea TaxID=44941 RepID=A0A397UEN5_9GLOM|nr:hypothetical protein C2G38_2147477 [Gigaspora rosea]